MDINSAAFWGGLGSIIVADILLSGDNSIVIALAVRSLPPQHQRRAIVWGSVAAIAMRVILTIAAARLLTQPYLKFAGGVLLFYIGVTLLAGDGDEDGKTARPAGAGVWAAIRTILIADLVMSLDNVIAIAAAARGHVVLLVIGLAISIPLIVFGSTLLLGVMQRYPVVITAGAALLGWLAGEMMLTDPAIDRHFGAVPGGVVIAAATAGAVLVVTVGLYLQRRRAPRPNDR